MRHVYIPAKKMNKETKVLLDKVAAIVDSYQQQGYRMTLRQLYYQLVAKLIIENKQSEYKKLSRLIKDARMAGLIDWDFIEDRVRIRDMPSEFDGISDLIDAAIRSYRRRRWDDQDNYVEVMVEKNALIGVVQPITEEYHVSVLPNIGYSSTTAVYETALRYKQAQDSGKKCFLLYFGDHDPSGEDMVRDIRSRIRTFGATVDVAKIALTMGQVQEFDLPPNPAKMTDPRADSYVKTHGDQSWELDALPPDILIGLIREAVRGLIDMDKYQSVIALEEQDKARLETLKDTFQDPQ